MILDFLTQIFDLVNEMSPYLLLGFFIAGLMHAFIPNSLYSKYLAGNNLRSVVNAAIFGVPLPLCSCGVIPTAMSLRREGASKGATVSFLIATPQTGVDSIFATYSIMGLPFAVVRPIAALVTALLGGVFVNSFEDDKSEVSAKVRKENEYSENENLTFVDRLKEALKFGFVEMMEVIGKWLVIGLLVAGLITVAVPDSMFAVFKDNTLASMLLVLCISIPMYLCATGSIPIAVALMMKGLTPGAALVLLMAGPASNAASILVIRKVLGKKSLILYLIAIVTGAVACGFAIDYLMPREWFVSSLMLSGDCCHEDTDWFCIFCTIVLTGLLLNVLWMRIHHKSACGCGHCHCDDEDHEEGGACCGHDHCEHSECEEDGTEQANVKVYSIGGMTCNHCCKNVERAIRGVEGVESVVVDLHSGEATVTGNAVCDDDVKSAVEGIGFVMK